MDPVTIVAAALAAGAAAGLTDTTKQVVTDAYGALKALIRGRYHSVDTEVIEQQPDSSPKRAVFAEQLRRAGADGDRELFTAARQLLVIVHQHAPQIADVIGVRIADIRAGELEISDISSIGTGVVAENTTVDGKFTITGVRAGTQEPPHPRQAR